MKPVRVFAFVLIPIATCAPPDIFDWVGLLGPPPRIDSDVQWKYWHYRRRLVSHFLQSGSVAAGHSLPAARLRHPTGLHWSDATAYLGWYLGVLATEHQLLRTGQLLVPFGHPFSEVSNQLDAIASASRETHFALVALDRLDGTGEAAFAAPPLCGGIQFDYQGFFIRDDVPAEFRVGGRPLYESDYSTPFNKTIVPGVVENWLVDNSVIYSKEPSQDQVYHLLLGLALVKRYMSGIIVQDVDLGYFADALAARLALRQITAGRENLTSAAVLSQVWLSAATFGPGGEPALGWDAGSYPDSLHMTMVLAAGGDGWGPGTLPALLNLAGVQWLGFYAPAQYRKDRGE